MAGEPRTRHGLHGDRIRESDDYLEYMRRCDRHIADAEGDDPLQAFWSWVESEYQSDLSGQDDPATPTPDPDFLAATLAIVLDLCVLTFAAGWAIAHLLWASHDRRTSLMFGQGMNSNGTGLVMASLALADHPPVVLPIIFHDLVQHPVAEAADHMIRNGGAVRAEVKREGRATGSVRTTGGTIPHVASSRRGVGVLEALSQIGQRVCVRLRQFGVSMLYYDDFRRFIRIRNELCALKGAGLQDSQHSRTRKVRIIPPIRIGRRKRVRRGVKDGISA